MSGKKKIILGVVIASLVVFIAVFIWFTRNGKNYIENQFSQNLNAKTSIGGFRVDLPLTVTVSKLEVGDFFRAEKITFSPDVLGFLFGKTVLYGLSVEGPVINLVQSADGKLNLPQTKKQNKPPQIFLTALTIKNGKCIFTDRLIRPEGLITTVDSISADIAKVMLPLTSLNTKFTLSGRIVDRDAKVLGMIESGGWIDFGPKDMVGTLVLKDVQVAYFEPYYGDFVSKKKLSSARLNIVSAAKAQHNDLIIQTNLQLSDIVYAQEAPPQEGEAPQTPDLTSSAMDLFTDNQGNLALDFTIKTKLDNPQITEKQLKQAIFNAAVKNLTSQSPEDLIKKVTGNIQQFEDFGKQMKELFKKKKSGQ